MSASDADKPSIASAEAGARPAIHVVRASGVDDACTGRVAIGAEELGIPTRVLIGEDTDAVALAHHGARTSRLGVGVGLAGDRIAIHERHMPAEQAVIVCDVSNDPMGQRPGHRRAGENAARLVVGRPLRLDDIAAGNDTG